MKQEIMDTVLYWYAYLSSHANTLFAEYIRPHISLMGLAIWLELVIIFILLCMTRARRHQRGCWMSVSKREDYVKRHAADLVVNELYAARDRGEITTIEMHALMNKLGRGMDLPDLLGRDWKALKKAIKTRLKSPKSWYNARKVKIPGEPLTVDSKIQSMSMTKTKS